MGSILSYSVLPYKILNLIKNCKVCQPLISTVYHLIQSLKSDGRYKNIAQRLCREMHVHVHSEGLHYIYRRQIYISTGLDAWAPADS